MFSNIVTYLGDRAKEASTWVSALLLLETAFNIHPSQAFNTDAVNLIMAIIAIGGVIVKEPWFTALMKGKTL